MRVYRWDLDKTYLHTDFESVRGLVRSAFESARQKRAIPGATALLRELARERPGWRPRISLLSGSPTQMRTVLEAKLRMDGVRFDSFVLKDNLGNLRKGRLRAVRDQFGYKLPHLLSGRVGLSEAVRETCFGDDAEADAVVYSLYADAIAGRVSAPEVSRVLEVAGAYPPNVVDALVALRRIERADAVDRIFIRLDRGEERRDFSPLGPRVIPIRSWFEAAVVMCGGEEIDGAGLGRILQQSGLALAEALEATRRMLERGAVEAGRLADALTEPGAPTELLPALLGNWTFRPPVPLAGIEYVDLVRRWRKGR